MRAAVAARQSRGRAWFGRGQRRHDGQGQGSAGRGRGRAGTGTRGQGSAVAARQSRGRGAGRGPALTCFSPGLIFLVFTTNTQLVGKDLLNGRHAILILILILRVVRVGADPIPVG